MIATPGQQIAGGKLLDVSRRKEKSHWRDFDMPVCYAKAQPWVE
jgi:hypothetical protein